MLDRLERFRPQIEDLCRRFGVRKLEIFGSAARQDFGPSSDLDFLVEFTVPPHLADFFALKGALEQLLARRVDLVTFEAIRNPYVRAAIQRDRRLVYGA